jgi:hypothetical protein
MCGLNQSPREFLHSAWLVDNGWQQCISDTYIYIFRAGSVFAMIAMYVGDIPAACNDATSFKARLGAMLKIKYLGDLSKLHDMHITRDRSTRTISLDHSKYMRDTLAKYGMSYGMPSSLHMDPGFLSGLVHMPSTPSPGWLRKSTPAFSATFRTRQSTRVPMLPRR